MLPINSGGHTAYQNFLIKMLRKYYPNPDAIARSTPSIYFSKFTSPYVPYNHSRFREIILYLY